MTVLQASKRRKLSPSDETEGEGRLSTLQNDFYTRAAGWNLEQDYERRQRKSRKHKENTRLPIKTAEGKIELPHAIQAQSEDDGSWLGSQIASSEEPETPVTAEEVTVSTRQHILEAKEELARVANLINEDPEEHAGGFRTLASIANSSNEIIKRLALVTQLTVYKDVIPGYRIRPIAEANQTEKVSKDVRRLRAFEQTLVSCYQSYVKDLAANAKRKDRSPADASTDLASVAVSCACALLLAVPHFNFRGDLLRILVGKLSSRRIDANFIKCRDTIDQLFRADDDGGSSLDAVSLITSMIKARKYQVNESVLNTFLHLRLLSELSAKASQNKVDALAHGDGVKGKKARIQKGFQTKKQRKLAKERKGIEKEFREADAIVSHEQRERRQSETLKLVFVTYFNILKARTPALMGAVLEGLAKYAHLINQDFFGDLLESLKDLISDAEKLLNPDEETIDENESESTSPKSERDYTREALLCTTTAFALLEGQDVAKSASALHLDLTFFTAHLYRNLHALALNPDLELSSKSLRLADPHSTSASTYTAPTRVNVKTTTVLLLRALASTLLPRTVPPVRIGGFTKQLMTFSLQLPEKSAIALLGLLTNVAKIHGRKIASLWNTEERKGDGVFDPLKSDLESSNPFASTVWEGELLKLHFAPSVREASKNIGTAIQGVK
ncbi:hypothetical protein ACLMJK_004926 [Lecanora helva]